jgi:purine-binding chemotaxis protein CheW
LTINRAQQGEALIVTIGMRSCAIPIEHVAETMRPLAIEPIAGMPEFIKGVSLIRGVPIPVVDLGALLQTSDRSLASGRFVTLKVAARRAAVAVDSVVGLRKLDLREAGELPPLLRAAGAEMIDAIGTCDAQLLIVLRAMRIIPDEVWARLEAGEGGP